MHTLFSCPACPETRVFLLNVPLGCTVVVLDLEFRAGQEGCEKHL